MNTLSDIAVSGTTVACERVYMCDARREYAECTGGIHMYVAYPRSDRHEQHGASIGLCRHILARAHCRHHRASVRDNTQSTCE
jgi:hypothetical protein